MTSLFYTKSSAHDMNVVLDVLESGQLVMGQHIEKFEEEFGYMLGDLGGVAACGSGTDALVLALEGLDCAGHGVLVPAMTFSATYEAVLKAGAIPIVCDVDDKTLTPTAQNILDAIVSSVYDGTGISAIILVHLYGWPAPAILEIMDFCQRHRIALIEDCAQSFGATVEGKKAGTFGDASAFSFYPTKPLGGIGDGGAVWFRNQALATVARARRNHGRSERGQTIPGYNSRLDETNAAVLRGRLKYYAKTVAARDEIAARYDLNGMKKLCIERRWGGVPYVYPILVDNREAIRFRLAEIGVETRVHYDPAVCDLPYVNADCPNAKWASRRVLSLPCHQGMRPEQVDAICDAVRTAETAAA